MKKIFSILTVIAASILFLVSCTSNNGDIGPLFGKWKLISIEYQGLPQNEEYKGDIFWSFQSKVISMQQIVDPNNEAWILYGSWILEDETLTLDFNEEEMLPSVLGLPLVSRLQVLKMTGSEMILIYRPDENSGITYRLKKW